MVQEQIQKENFGEWGTRPEPDGLLVRRSSEVGDPCTLDAIMRVRFLSRTEVNGCWQTLGTGTGLLAASLGLEAFGVLVRLLQENFGMGIRESLEWDG